MSDAPRYRRLFDLRLGGRRRTDEEMDREIEAHIAMRTTDLVRAGWSENAARIEAERRFGDLPQARRSLHTAARQRAKALLHRDRLGALGADLRYAMRQVRRAPAFAAIAISTLAIGIGATTAIFTLVDHVLLRPLPFAHSDRLYALSGLDSAHNTVPTISSSDWLDWRTARSITGSAIYSFPLRQPLVTADSAARVSAERVSSNYFDVLGAHFSVGRPFTERGVESSPDVVVISERLWRTMFGADSSLAVPLRTARRKYTIVGVVRGGEEFPAGTDVWFPVKISRAADPSRVNVNWYQIARLAPGVSPSQAAAELTTIAERIRAADPSAIYDYGAEAKPLAASVIGDAGTYLRLLLGVTALVLLIVCANVAAAGLARSASRSREIAVRTSLGATRGRVVRQLLTENLCLGLLGGAIGLVLAWAVERVMLATWGGQIPRAGEVSIDGRVFLFTLGVSLAAGVLAGVVPAIRSTRTDPRAALAAGGRTSARGGRGLAGASLVAGEIALALLLLTGAGLLVRSFRSLLGRGLGIETHIATASVELTGDVYGKDPDRRLAYWSSLIAQFRSIPGARSAAVANWIPLGITGQSFIDVGGRDTPGAGAVYRSVSAGFFGALGIRLVAGRTFDAEDGTNTLPVVVINRRMAEQYWPGESPIGKLVRATSMERGPNGQATPWRTVIGVVSDIRTYGLESDARPEMYSFYEQTPGWTYAMQAVVGGSPDPASLAPEMRRRARQLDPHVPIDVGTIDGMLRNSLAPRVLTMSLLSAFACLAIVLAAIGIYGVLSFSVAQRTRELAVRAALGAERASLLWLVMRAGLHVVFAGAAIGLVAAWALTRLLGSMLIDVAPSDPLTYAGALAVLLVVALAAIVVPAHRAMGLDPLIALRAE